MLRLFETLEKKKKIFAGISSVIVAIIAGIAIIPKFLPQNIRDGEIEFVKFFIYSALHEIKFFICLLLFILIIYFLFRKIFSQIKVNIEDSKKISLLNPSLIIFVILSSICIGALWNPILKESYYIARARYYFWTQLFHREYSYSLIDRARKNERSGDLNNALKFYKIALEQTQRSYILYNLERKIKNIEGQIKYSEILYQKYLEAIKKDGFDREAFFYLSEAYRIESNNELSVA